MDAPLSSARHNQEPQQHEKRRDRERTRERSHSRRRRSRSRSRKRRDRSRSRSRERRRDDGGRRRDDGRRRDQPRHDDRRAARPAWGGDTDADLPHLRDDPREQGPLGKAQRAALGLGVATGRNTESFDPKSTLVRPSFRVRVCSGSKPKYDKPLKHDDIVIVPEFFCAEDDWSLYYKLIDEMRESQQRGKAPGSRGPGPEWQSWHEGAHLISKDPSGSKTYQAVWKYQEVQKKMGDFFGLQPQSRGTRFNWYNNPSDWKPFHHDSAAFNAQRARNQNCTVGVSFGDARELAFVDALDPSKRFYFPQTNGGLFYFGRDVNIRIRAVWKFTRRWRLTLDFHAGFKHGVNLLPEEDRTGKGRVSIILWGQADVIDEAGSPPHFTDPRSPHFSQHGKGGGKGRGGGRGRGFGGRGGGRGEHFRR